MTPDYPEPEFFNSRERVIEIGEAFRLYKFLPKAGGIDDQLEEDWHDIKVYMNLIAYAQHLRNLGGNTDG